MGDAHTNESSKTDDENERPQKKLKITASNGYLVLHKNLSKSTMPASKSKSTPLKRANSKATLALLPSLPLDILFEIFGHLLPYDILQLARTTKDFRRVLLDESAISIWKSALSNMPELPECPPDLSIPAWINLAFDSHCHNCLTTNVSADWVLRVRLCKKCAKTCLKSSEGLDERYKADKIILQCVPFSFGTNRGFKHCTIKAREAFIKELGSVEGDRSEFVKQKTAEMKARMEHAKRCQKWSLSLLENRWDEIDDIRRERRKAIHDKLVALGYETELEYLDEQLNVYDIWSPPKVTLFGDHPSVKAIQPFTERIWKNIKSDMIEYMEEMKAIRIKDNRGALLNKRRTAALDAWFKYRLSLKEESDFMPSTVDLLLWQDIRQIVERPDDAAEVTSATFEEAFHALPRFVDKWRNQKINDLLRRSLYNFPITGPKPLELAVCVFKCTATMRPPHERSDSNRDWDTYACMWYPECIHHPCNSISWIPWDEANANVETEDMNPILTIQEYKNYRRTRWTSDTLEFDDKASWVVKNILDACKLDHLTTTATELDEVDPRLVCLKCSLGLKCDGERLFQILTWRNAVRHCIKVHWGDRNVAWQRISEEDTRKARILEQVEAANRGIALPLERKWRCTHCRDTANESGRMTFYEMEQHFEDSEHTSPHDVILRQLDYYLALENAPRQPLSVKMAPRPP